MSAIGLIPARYASSRFPGKPLAKIAGMPMIEHVWRRSRAARSLRDVMIATDDERIADTCRGFGAVVAMTSADHPTGTDRLAEVAASLDDEIIVNIQGDEPLIEGRIIDQLVEAIREESEGHETPMATLVHRADAATMANPDRVKVVLDQQGFALYFSRSPIPYDRGAGDRARDAPLLWQHIGLYAYRRGFLLDFVKLEQTPAERTEALEQLRALEHGYRIRTAVVEGWESRPVDRPEDVEDVERELADAEQRAQKTPGEGPGGP